MPPKMTPFQQRAYYETRKIPQGTVTTYGDLTRLIGCGSAQAVGRALCRNPFAPEVPSHRVVATGGSLHGYCGTRFESVFARKRALLESKEMTFDNGSVWL